MRSKIIVTLFVLALLANQTLAYSYRIAYCKQGPTLVGGYIFYDNTVMHAFCEGKSLTDCENKWTDYSLSDDFKDGIDSPCYGDKLSFSDHRGQHTLECIGGTLVALRHHDHQGKDYCTTMKKYDRTFEIGYSNVQGSLRFRIPAAEELYGCYSKWQCGN